jgi:hypothetical protein
MCTNISVCVPNNSGVKVKLLTIIQQHGKRGVLHAGQGPALQQQRLCALLCRTCAGANTGEGKQEDQEGPGERQRHVCEQGRSKAMCAAYRAGASTAAAGPARQATQWCDLCRHKSRADHGVGWHAGLLAALTISSASRKIVALPCMSKQPSPRHQHMLSAVGRPDAVLFLPCLWLSIIRPLPPPSATIPPPPFHPFPLSTNPSRPSRQSPPPPHTHIP